MKVLDLDTWSRKEIYEMFSSLEWPFYAVTIPVDVTNVKMYSKQQGLSFYYLMIWLCTKAVNSVEEFRLRLRNGQLVYADVTNPSFTDARPDEADFHITTLPWEEDAAAFCEKAKAQNAIQTSFKNIDKESDELIYVSSTPWFDFTSLTNEHALNRDDFIPRLCWGKYYPVGERLYVHLSVEVNHRIIDGKHLGLLKEAIDKEVAGLAQNSNHRDTDCV